ncbi:MULTISPECIES: FxSxx-COOH system tetratricopeptide repeat protein [Streptomyces]|uniref:ATP/GTP binding protein n=3 Tax=Streptomyces TaxID=1883 RepID=Q9L0M8_STRCO|nr:MULTISPECIES: FxSxx-COOH system tetratricopeptide repeat protein [Streptomyces]MYU44152.1 tetratricopeptide repeat protein [Streptomyces sp. SID7813]MDX2929821.1 FxSxx-COOH system tetratricopeptide repeat protein [Streptomyces sp. NRRL_B-16638]MDX3370028.1 FxSxx-COOH system tetratricopeptide repeat protein [Streptomyces sp. ME02-6987-2C]MDX3408415.1 FxSxx-COOH system tetratricopeptide repeat protein [Streptomyces sp. ME02-6977A]MDX3424135.1 FxSxx-COOH system tetratricopeptide repeat protein
MTDTTQRIFLSYAGPDQAWAEWVGWQLQQAGHQVELDRWHWRTGDDFVQKMNLALGKADAVVALFSRHYFEPKRWTREEWSAAVALRGRLVPVAIELLNDDDIPALLAGTLRTDVHGLDEAAATSALLEAVHGPVPPTGPVDFPGAASADAPTAPDAQRPRLPSSVGLPEVWNVRRRNPDFSGRETVMGQLRTGLLSGRQAVVQALHGMGGIGKTQIALEYAHRFASQYDLVWWVDAEQADQLPVRYTELADRLGVAKSDAGSEPNARALLQHLRTRHRWLLVLDNAEHPDQIEPWLPEGPGHVLITSRNPDWHGIAHQSDLDVFTRTDSLAYLKGRISGMTTEHADLLAQDLGDLPLALAQASGVLRSGMTLDRYRRLLTTDTARLLQESDVRDHPAPLAATVGIAVTRLADDGHADAVALLRLGAFLGPEPIPTAWLETARPRLATIPGDPDDPMWLRNALQPLGRFGLARTDYDAFQIHRLTQAILRTQTGPDPVVAIRDDVTAVLAAVDPGDPRSPADWPAWASLTAHLTAPHVTTALAHQAALRATFSKAAHFLICSGLPRAAHDLSAALHQAWSTDLGPDHPDTLTCAQFLGHATVDLGDYAKGRLIIEDTLVRRRRVLGEDHPDTLRSANDTSTNLSLLGERVEARRMHEDVLARRRRVLGEDHPDTLTSAGNLATILNKSGEYVEARRMQEDVLARRRRVLGEDHPDTLTSAHNLAGLLNSLGEHAESRRMQEDVLARRGLVLGEDHPDTLSSASNLATSLNSLGEHAESRRMHEDVLARRGLVLGQDHPDTLSSANKLATSLNGLGEHAEARRMHEDVLARRGVVLGQDHPSTLASAGNLATTLNSLGEHVEAHRMQEDVLARCRRVLGQDHPDTLTSASNLARTLHTLRQYSEAAELLKEVRASYVRHFGAKHPKTELATRNLATVLIAMGKTHEAQQLTGRKSDKGKRRFGRKRR